MFAWEAYEKGTDAHVQADPTKLELLSREFNKRKDTFIETKKESIISKYGGEQHLDAPPKQLLLAQTVRQFAKYLVIFRSGATQCNVNVVPLTFYYFILLLILGIMLLQHLTALNAVLCAVVALSG